jgi:hypothetical protein
MTKYSLFAVKDPAKQIKCQICKVFSSINRVALTRVYLSHVK